jgi:hypothetical protein
MSRSHLVVSFAMLSRASETAARLLTVRIRLPCRHHPTAKATILQSNRTLECEEARSQNHRHSYPAKVSSRFCSLSVRPLRSTVQPFSITTRRHEDKEHTSASVSLSMRFLRDFLVFAPFDFASAWKSATNITQPREININEKPIRSNTPFSFSAALSSLPDVASAGGFSVSSTSANM